MPLKEHSKALSASLAEAKLVPGVAASLIPEDFKPTTKLDVAFDGTAVKLGNLFRTSQCRLAPSIRFSKEPDSPSDATYMLLLVDPDAPTPDDPKFAFWRHWVLPGLMPLSGDEGLIAQVQPALTEYLGPGPKDEQVYPPIKDVILTICSSKPHRYLFLLFRQPTTLDLTKEDVGGEEFVQRRSFDPVKFVEKHDLHLVGLNWMLGAGDGWKSE